MDSHERLNRRAVEQEWMRTSDRPNRIGLILLVVLSSFAVGLIPLAYAANGTSQAIVTSEAGVWNILGKK